MDDTGDVAAEHSLPLARLEPGALGRWWRQGLRTALLRQPQWLELQATPTVVALLVAAVLLLDVLLQRLYIVGDASFYWPALYMAWLPTAITAWACWCLVPRASWPAGIRPGHAPTAAALFAMLSAQALMLALALALILVPMVRVGLFDDHRSGIGVWARWAAWWLPLAWILAATLTLVWRASAGAPRRRVLVMALLGAVLVGNAWLQPLRTWYPAAPGRADMDSAPIQLTQEAFEDQAATLDMRLASIAPRRAGAINVFAITYAPYADEDVFMRESKMVAKVMADRFDARERTIQLINHRATGREWPWATALNLQRSIEHIARRMNRDEDILFLHLTSHGARSGSLATSFSPLTTESLTPAMLKAWLDSAGIRHRIVSVSACYSGSWIDPLADDDTLVMTAADADHTSYGCGRGSELTYFGRALFDEQLRNQTFSFEAAHATARRLIDEREKQAGKSDGYSNPQIRVGAAMRERLAMLESQRKAASR